MGGINNYAQRCALLHNIGGDGDKFLGDGSFDHDMVANRLKK